MAFVFDRDFDEEAEFEERRRIHAKRAIYTPEDLEEAVQKARQEAYEDGRMAGRTEASIEASETVAARSADALVVLAPQLKQIIEQADQHKAALEYQLLDYVLTVFRQIAPELATETALIRSETEIKKAIGMAVGTSYLRIHLPADLAGDLTEKIEQQVQAAGFDGRVQIQTDGRMKAGDTRVVWDNGLMDFSLTELSDKALFALRQAAAEALARRNNELE
jgi:flagellar assembly protein FliH